MDPRRRPVRRSLPNWQVRIDEVEGDDPERIISPDL